MSGAVDPVDALASDFTPIPGVLYPGALRFAAEGDIFGPIVEDLATAAYEQIGEVGLDPELAVGAMALAATLFTNSEQAYRDNGGMKGYQVRPLTDDSAALAEHHENVRNGEIVLLDPDFWATQSFGETQVTAADIALGDVFDERAKSVQAVLAALQYGRYFNAKTMADGTLTIARADVNDLLESESLEAMNHLSITNWAIGHTVSTIYESLARMSGRDAHLNIVDLCSGSGATFAAITNSLKRARDNSQEDSMPTLSASAIDVTPELFLELMDFAHRDFATRSLFREVGVAVHKTEVADGKLQLINGDVVETILSDDGTELFGKRRKNQVHVVAANYGWHRLSTEAKQLMLQSFADQENMVLVIGDLSRNGSAVNRGYFDLSANGPLNTGNQGLTQLMEGAGFKVVDIQKQKPRDLDQRLRDRILEEEGNDMHFWIAYKGELAQAALDLTA